MAMIKLLHCFFLINNAIIIPKANAPNKADETAPIEDNEPA